MRGGGWAAAVVRGWSMAWVVCRSSLSARLTKLDWWAGDRGGAGAGLERTGKGEVPVGPLPNMGG